MIPNLHFLGIADFQDYCKKRNIQIEDSASIRKNSKVKLFPNLFAEIGLFVCSKKAGSKESPISLRDDS